MKSSRAEGFNFLSQSRGYVVLNKSDCLLELCAIDGIGGVREIAENVINEHNIWLLGYLLLNIETGNLA